MADVLPGGTTYSLFLAAALLLSGGRIARQFKK
jgi:hypothetical protein